MIENEPVFEPLKIKQEVHEKLVQNSRNNDNTTGNLLDLYASILQYINFTEKLEQNDGLFFIPEKQQKTILNISLDSLVETK